jgi:hypothetical protein
VKPNRNGLFLTAQILYYGFIVANIIMQTIEIARLELLWFGIGLQPFTYVGLILGAILHGTAMGMKIQGVHGWMVINMIIWIGGMAMCTIQAIGLGKEGMEARKGSKYPLGDQVLDVAVMAGVYVVIATLEVLLGVWKTIRVRGSAESLRSETREMVIVK